MSLSPKISAYAVLLILFVSCSSSDKSDSFDDSYYQKTEKEWLTSLPAIEEETSELRNHVLLILHTTECSPCLQELAWWNTRGRKEVKADISLLVIERYERVFNSFLKAENISLPAFRDSAAQALKQDLVPTTPVKLYFDDRGEISAIDYMGTKGDVQKFVRQIASSK